MNPNTSITFNNNNVDKKDKKTALSAINFLQKYFTEENNEKKPEENNVKSLNDQVSYDKLKENFDSLLAEKQNLEVKCEELEKINSNLKKRVSKYQSALGETKNFRFDDNDKNNSVQLKNDILNLQDALEFYVTNLRPDIDINYKNVSNLLSKYKSKTRISTRHSDIPLIKAVLQRHVLETIFGYVSVYNTHKSFDKPYSLEALISIKAEELILLTQEFGMTREGNDSITPAVPVKIRQQIYSSLGNRGLSNVTIGQETYEHAFIYNFKTRLNEEMEQYRKILNITKKREIEEKAANLILDVIRIFFFRIQTQEPIGKIHWFQNKDKIDSSLMICTWDDDRFDDIEVDICIFPLIGTELNNHLKRKVYTHAIIYPREVDSLQSNLETKTVNSQSQSEQPKYDVNYQSQSKQSDINSQSQSPPGPEENEESSQSQSSLETNSQSQSNPGVNLQSLSQSSLDENSQSQSQSSPEENKENSQSQSSLETNSQSQSNPGVNSQSLSQSSLDENSQSQSQSSPEENKENSQSQSSLETNSQSQSNPRVNLQSQSQSSPEENEENFQSQSNLETNSQLQSNHEVNSQSQSQSQSSPEENSRSQSSLETNSQSQSNPGVNSQSQSQSSPEENEENSQSQSNLETNSQSQFNHEVNSQSRSQSSSEENSNLETNSQSQSNLGVNSQSQTQSSPEKNEENPQLQPNLETSSQLQSNNGVNSQSSLEENAENTQPQPNLETNSQSKSNPEVNSQFHSQYNHEANSQSQSQSNQGKKKN